MKPSNSCESRFQDATELSSAASESKLASSDQLAPTVIGNSKGRKTQQTKFKHLLVVALFFFGLIVCVSSLVCIILLPSFLTNQIAKRLVLKNNSLLLERWSKPNVPMYFKVWVFHVDNAQEVLERRGTKPRLKEIGPFVFHLKRQKDVVSFAGDNLYYTERKLYHFSPELSCCAINTTVTVPNIPLVAVVDRALSYNLPLVGRFIPRLINRAIQSLREQLFVRKQVRELLFDGYEVELLKMVSRVGSLVGLPQTNQKFALLKGRNDTWRPDQDGVWAINTGARDRRLFGKVASWNSYKQLPFWAAPACNTINGSDGTLFPPPIKKTEPLYIFNQELCRTVNLIYERPSDIRAIKAYRYVLNPLNFAHTMTPTRTLSAAGLQVVGNVNLIDNPPKQQTAASAGPGAGARETINAGRAIVGSVVSSSLQPQPQPQQQQPLARPALATGTNSNADLRATASEAAEIRTPINSGSADTGKRWLPTGTSALNRQQPSPLIDGPESTAQAQKLVQAAQEAAAKSERRSPKNPNTCFCDRKTTNLNGNNVCEFDGLIDLSKCTKQAQVIFGSMPHFHQSDPRLLRQVLGLEPNASKHTTYLDIEPNTGLVLGGKRRVQLNLIIKHNNEVDGFENINDMLIPVVWFEESAMIPEESAKKFKSLYTDRVRLVYIVLTTLFFAALALLAVDLKLLAAHYTHCFQKFKLKHCKEAVVGGITTAMGQKSAKNGLQTLDKMNNGHEKPLSVDRHSSASPSSSSSSSSHSPSTTHLSSKSRSGNGVITHSNAYLKRPLGASAGLDSPLLGSNSPNQLDQGRGELNVNGNNHLITISDKSKQSMR